jgi:hypothetical protein
MQLTMPTYCKQNVISSDFAHQPLFIPELMRVEEDEKRQVEDDDPGASTCRVV